MRILIAHNRYRQSGGEDNVAAAEAALLRRCGHAVEQLELDNDHIQGGLAKIAAAVGSLYSLHGKATVREAIERFRPDVVHVHNFFPSFSPAIFRACEQAGIPAVHTLHNFRIVCAGATLFRDGRVCEECLNERSSLPGARHGCYRGSRAGSAVSGLGMALHERLGTWAESVAAYIALTEFAAGKLGTWRVSRGKIVVKPNFTADHGVGEGDGDYAVFAGRLSPEKGLQTLIEADAAGQLAMEVVVLGDGPMLGQVTSASERPGSRLKPKGRQTHAQILEFMRHARVLVLPSLWYEGLPLVLLEAFSLGLPVLGAGHGSLAELIEPGRTGMLFEPGDALDFAAKLAWFASETSDVRTMREEARARYLERYTPEVNYLELFAIYTKVTSKAEISFAPGAHHR